MDGREGELLKTDGGWTMRFERRLDPAPDKVWTAIVGPGAMSRWFDETHMPDPLEVGANIRFVHAQFGMESRGEITALDPPRLIEWLWVSDFGPASRMRWEIKADGGGSRLILSQAVSDPPVTSRTMAGWHKCLDRMEAVLEGGGEPGGKTWLDLFETVYKPKVLAAGLTVPQVGAPEPKTT